MRWLAVAAAVLGSGLAGCIANDETVGPLLVPDDVPNLSAAGAVATGGDPLPWTGRVLYENPSDREACLPSNCERFEFDFALPPGYWDANAGALEVSVAWDKFMEVWFELRVLDASGQEVGEHHEAWDFNDHSQGHMVLIADAPPGRYAAEVRVSSGGGPYQGVAQVESRPRDAPVEELLPDVVPLQPVRFTVEMPCCPPFPEDLLEREAREPVSREGCYVHEAAETEARRCLRFSSGVGNLGPGRLEVQIPHTAFAGALPVLGAATQRLYSTDGSFRDQAAGQAAFHAAHKHFHYLGLVEFQLFAYDLDAGTRGELAREGARKGMCFGDEGIAALGLPGTVGRLYGWTGCLDYYPFVAGPEAALAGWMMGLSPGWYDEYDNWQPDQYVDITGLADGVYELVLAVNVEGSLLEASAENNEASTVIRLTGNEVEVLATRGGY